MLATIETIACSFNTNQTDAAVFKKRMENPSFLQLGDSTVVEAGNDAQRVGLPAEIAALIMPADPEQEAWIQQ